MPKSALGEVLRFLNKACAMQGTCDLTDRELVERFLCQGDEGAFTFLVRRHGPMIFGICRRVLGDAHEAEDALQATFLVLVRRTRSIRRKESVGSWLYGVAQRIALRARAQNAARRRREKEAGTMRSRGSADDLTMQELRSALDEAIGSLAEKYRAPIVLCYLEGRSYDKAARELGCPKSSLESRLDKARELLQRKLERRGITLAVGALATALAEVAAAAPLPAILTIKTVKAATLVATGKAVAGGCISAHVLALAEEAMRGMLWVKAKMILMVVGLGLAVGGAGWAGYGLQGTFTSAKGENPGAPTIRDNTTGTAKKGSSVASQDSDDPLPVGSMLRFGTSRYRHGTRIVGLAVSEDGKVAAASSDHTQDTSVRVFDLNTGHVRATICNSVYTHSEGVALSPDGRMFATNENYVIHIRDAITGKELRSISPDKVNSRTVTDWLLFSPDGKKVAVATAEGNGIHLLDVDKATIVRTFRHQNIVFAAAFSPDGKLLVGGGYDNEKANYFVRLWEVASGKELRRFANGRADIRALGFSADGKILAGGGQNAQLRLWDVETGNELRKFASDGYRIRSIAFTSDGKTVAAAGATIRLYDPVTGQERLRIDRHATGLHFSAEGKILTGAVMGAIYRWDAVTGRQLTPEAAGDSVVDQILVSSDGRRVVTRGQDGDTHIWDVKTGAHLRYLKTTWQRGIALSPDGRFLVWPESEDKVHFKDPATPNSVLTGSRIRLYEIAAEQLINRFQEFEGDAQDLIFARDGNTLVTVDHRDARVRVWNVATGKEQRRFYVVHEDEKAKQHHVWQTLLAPDGWTLAVTYQPDSFGFNATFSVRLWDMTTGKELHELPGHLNYVNGMAFSPDSRIFVTGSDPLFHATKRPANQVFVWDVATGQRVAALPDGLPIGATCMAYSPDGWTFATAAADGAISLWETASYSIRAEFRGHRDRVTSLAFNQDGDLLSGSVDTTVLAWDIRPPLGKSPESLAAAWDALLKRDALLAFKAMGRFQSSPIEAVALLAEQLKPADPVDPKRLDTLIADVDSQQYRVRQQALQALDNMGEAAKGAVRKHLQAKPSLETQQRLEVILDKRGKDPEVLRRLRAVETLERIGTTEAQQLLRLLIDRTPNPTVVKAAAAALQRLGR